MGEVCPNAGGGVKGIRRDQRVSSLTAKEFR